MIKGVKKIKWTGDGIVKKDLSIPNKKVVIAPDQHVFFTIEKWYDATTESDKKKNITWIFQDLKTRTIVLQKTLPVSNKYGVKLPKNLCGPFEYYLEASLSGKRDVINKTGLLISGNCPAKITSSKWCTSNDGKDVSKSQTFNYGDKIYLNLVTEGVNGNLNLSVDVFRKTDDKKALFRYTSVDVIDGEINLEIKNTFSWYSGLKGVKETEEFYVKVFDPANQLYIPNDKNETKHGSFLKINKKISSKEVTPPTNLSPLKTGAPDKNAGRYDHCKFETITIIDDKKDDDKTVKINALVFDNGKKLANPVLKKELINKTILFEFDKSDITPEAKTILNNTLQFLLEHQFSSIKIDGHACVIGKENYNQKLSQQRSDAVKKIFVDGGLDTRRITSVGHGEVNPTDDKQGGDNIKYKDEKKYIENRRVDILFDAYTHDAQTIIYETVAPSTGKNITIDITEYQNKTCFKIDEKHKKNIRINSAEYDKPIDKVINKLDFPIKSNLVWWNIAPLRYIWPKVLANQYNIHAHSCRYFSNESNPTIQALVYSDIKWNLQLSFNWEHAFAYTHGNLPEYSRKDPKDPKVAEIIREKRKAQSKAVGSGKEFEKTSNSPEMLTKFELKLEGKWGGQAYELSGEFAKKIRTVLGVFIKYKEMADRAKNQLKGAPIIVGKKPPFMFEVMSPSLNANIDWYLEKGTGINASKVATVGQLNFKADPLVGAEFTIDLLAVLSNMHPFAKAFIATVEGTLEAANGGISITCALKGSLEFDFNAIKFNSLTGFEKGGTLNLGAKLQFKAELILHAAIKSKSVKAEPILTLDVKGKFDAYITGKLKFDCDEIGVFCIPEVAFSGMIFTFEIELVIRGHKQVRKFGNENEPFLKPEPYSGDKYYLPFNNKPN